MVGTPESSSYTYNKYGILSLNGLAGSTVVLEGGETTPQIENEEFIPFRLRVFGGNSIQALW
jgi:hypothetical protein